MKKKLYWIQWWPTSIYWTTSSYFMTRDGVFLWMYPIQSFSCHKNVFSPYSAIIIVTSVKLLTGWPKLQKKIKCDMFDGGLLCFILQLSLQRHFNNVWHRHYVKSMGRVGTKKTLWYIWYICPTKTLSTLGPGVLMGKKRLVLIQQYIYYWGPGWGWVWVRLSTMNGSLCIIGSDKFGWLTDRPINRPPCQHYSPCNILLFEADNLQGTYSQVCIRW